MRLLHINTLVIIPSKVYRVSFTVLFRAWLWFTAWLNEWLGWKRNNQFGKMISILGDGGYPKFPHWLNSLAKKWTWRHNFCKLLSILLKWRKIKWILWLVSLAVWNIKKSFWFVNEPKRYRICCRKKQVVFMENIKIYYDDDYYYEYVNQLLSATLSCYYTSMHCWFSSLKNYTFLIIFNQALHCLAAIINKIYKPSYKSNQVSVKWSDPLNLLFFI